MGLQHQALGCAVCLCDALTGDYVLPGSYCIHSVLYALHMQWLWLVCEWCFDQGRTAVVLVCITHPPIVGMGAKGRNFWGLCSRSNAASNHSCVGMQLAMLVCVLAHVCMPTSSCAWLPAVFSFKLRMGCVSLRVQHHPAPLRLSPYPFFHPCRITVCGCERSVLTQE